MALSFSPYGGLKEGMSVRSQCRYSPHGDEEHRMSYDDDDDDYDEDEDDTQEYECQNKGCVGDRIFEAAPEEWFEDHGMDPPKNCPTCREWNADQKNIGPIVATCQFCAFTWPYEATYRIIYHKKTGNWDEYWSQNEELQICHRCMEMPFRRRKLRERGAERDRRKRTPKEKRARNAQEPKNWKELLLKLMEERGLGHEPQRFNVPDSMVYYEGVKTPADRVDAHGENQLTHILKSDHAWAEKLGTEDPYTVLSLAYHIAVSSESHVLQFTDLRNKKVIKYDPDQEVVVIIQGDKKSPTGNRIETTHPKTPKGVYNKLD